MDHFRTRTQVENFNLMQKAVSRLILNSSGMTVITKALHSWKEFVLYRKRVRMFAQKVLAYRLKADLMSSFNIWRVSTRNEKRKQEDLSKKELKKRILIQNNQRFLLENSTQQSKHVINEMETELERNMRNFVRKIVSNSL